MSKVKQISHQIYPRYEKKWKVWDYNTLAEWTRIEVNSHAYGSETLREMLNVSMLTGSQ